jgi:FkbM family methyltransferase
MLQQISHFIKMRPVARRRRAVGEPRCLTERVQGQLLQLRNFQIYVDPLDTQIGRMIWDRGRYEAHVEAALFGLLKPGDTFLDIGANVGYHSLFASRLVGQKGSVISIEMSPENIALFRASVQANQMTNIRLHETAVADTEGKVRFCVTRLTGNGMLVNDYLQQRIEFEPENFSAPATVNAVTVNSLIPPGQKVDVVKIDIEGSELRALRGMSRVLRESRPIVVFEFCPTLLENIGGAEPEELLRHLRSLGYQLRHLHRRSVPGDPALSDAELLRRTLPTGLIDVIATVN